MPDRAGQLRDRKLLAAWPRRWRTITLPGTSISNSSDSSRPKRRMRRFGRSAHPGYASASRKGPAAGCRRDARRGEYDLAGAIRMPTGQTLPLPSDIPHVGPYRTELDNVYSGRAIPPRRADRSHVAGAAQRHRVACRGRQRRGRRSVAAEESHFEGRSDLALVLSLVDELSRQRAAFMVDVRTYNLDIAEYAMSAPTPPLDPQGLASMLIKPTTGPAQPGTIAGGTTNSGAAPNTIERAGFTQPLARATVTAAAGARGTTQPGPATEHGHSAGNERSERTNACAAATAQSIAEAAARRRTARTCRFDVDRPPRARSRDLCRADQRPSPKSKLHRPIRFPPPSRP